MNKLNKQQERLAFVFIRKSPIKNLTSAEIRTLIANKNHPFWDAFQEATRLIVAHEEEPKSVPFVNLVDDEMQGLLSPWIEFYKKYFDIDVDFSDLKIPKRVFGFDRLIVISKGLSLDYVHKTENKHYTIWNWCSGELSSSMQERERGLVKTNYAIWVRDSRDSDPDLLGLSAEEVERPLETETLLERKIHGFKYHIETGGHLDQGSCTICPSSMDKFGQVIEVDNVQLTLVRMRALHKGYKNARAGARRVVRDIQS